jgi:hypothetical protein
MDGRYRSYGAHVDTRQGFERSLYQRPSRHCDYYDAFSIVHVVSQQDIGLGAQGARIVFRTAAHQCAPAVLVARLWAVPGPRRKDFPGPTPRDRCRTAWFAAPDARHGRYGSCANRCQQPTTATTTTIVGRSVYHHHHCWSCILATRTRESHCPVECKQPHAAPDPFSGIAV